MSAISRFPKKVVKGFDAKSYPHRINTPVFPRTVKGDIGIEVEMEGRGFEGISGKVGGVGWTPHRDNSLRGESMEYVLDSPCKRENVEALTSLLFDQLHSSGARIDDSYRTSVHVHLNAQDLKINQLCSFISLWGVLEDVLVNWCGEYRVGNLFCLRFRDCDWATDIVRQMFKQGSFGDVREQQRYLALNLHSLIKFNSFEIRSLRGVSDADTINRWVDILWKIYEAAKAYVNPEDIAGDLSGYGPVGFLERIIGAENASIIIRHNSELGEDVEGLIWAGIRRMQPVIYSLPWPEMQEELNRVAIPNPFMKSVRISKARAPEGHFIMENPLR